VATKIPFIFDLTFEYGVAEQVSPLIRRVIAPNGGSFTFHGTGTYIVGRGKVAVIDPGPALPDHVDAILAAVEGETISHQIITHTHRDHSPAARLIAAETGAKTYGFGPHGGGRGAGDVEEGADHDFSPDVTVRDGDVIAGEGWTLEAVHTPGHTSNHLCFGLAEENALFSGDHVMGWSTSVISPPDGDMAAYFASLEKLLARDDHIYWPTHGAPITDPKPLVEAFIAHRRDREQQISDCLRRGINAIPRMVEAMYPDIDPGLHPAAARSVLAHLIHMVEDNRAACDGAPDESSHYRPATCNEA
jgi:glyoxylase-like metal-dependent hydrolase (beta-lactamase superfamily II)